MFFMLILLSRSAYNYSYVVMGTVRCDLLHL